MRRENILIPRPEELMRGEVERRIQGALTMPPKSGVYFNTVVVDFESLYPSVIDAYNLSYETIDCGHPECVDNRVPGLGHHVCRLRRGIYSILIGALKDLRIRWFKPLSRDESISPEERRLAEATAKLLKLILVSSYGVTIRIRGLANPSLAESITAYGRYALKEAWNMAINSGLKPIYGDTDSLFLDNPDEDALNKLIRDVKRRLRLDLAIDKRYTLCVLPRAMKSYFGIKPDGTPDIKGVTAIKSNSPPIIQEVFRRCVRELVGVRDRVSFELAKGRMQEIFTEAVRDLKSGRVPLEELEYTVKLRFDPTERAMGDEVLHQPYQCAVQLLDRGVRVGKGSTVSFVKVKPFTYRGRTFTVKPTSLVRGMHEVNVDDYIRSMRSSLNQVFRRLGVEFTEKPEKAVERSLIDFI
ncbi:hypothetical protein DRO55_06060 [Candidatus Bathyarchaeota archaeon]|nr:MAG: hypothetical protein DRO55_06060 [Candidatus Bathyarchaeota archaeon]